MGFDFGRRTDRTQTFALSLLKNKAEMSSYCRGCYNNIWWYLWTVVGHFRQYGAGRVLWGLGQYRAGATWRKQQSLSETELQTSYLLCCTENQPWSWTSSWVFATGKRVVKFVTKLQFFSAISGSSLFWHRRRQPEWWTRICTLLCISICHKPSLSSFIQSLVPGKSDNVNKRYLQDGHSLESSSYLNMTSRYLSPWGPGTMGP